MSTGDYKIFSAYVMDLESSTTASGPVAVAEAPSTSNPAMDALLAEYEDVFAPLPHGVPKRKIQHPINLVPGIKPASRCMSPAELQEVQRQLADYLDKGFIQKKNQSRCIANYNLMQAVHASPSFSGMRGVYQIGPMQSENTYQQKSSAEAYLEARRRLQRVMTWVGHCRSKGHWLEHCCSYQPATPAGTGFSLPCISCQVYVVTL